MQREINIGGQSFEKLRVKDLFYVDKTSFIREWWESNDDVTLITRPRRFGKTLNLDMLNCFFSNQYAGRSDLFQGLDIWKEEEYRKLQGTYPVIYLSFARVKDKTMQAALHSMQEVVTQMLWQYTYLLKSGKLAIYQRKKLEQLCYDLKSEDIPGCLNLLSQFLYIHYGKKVLIFLDEYDTPLQEAYNDGYWDEMSGFIRSLFNSTFKTNPYLERGLMTGITRVSKESIFSDLNNLNVVTTTSSQYETAFGFTEKEVSQALDEYQLSDQKAMVRHWYDGFTFGSHSEIYNPWSITNYLKFRKFRTYWANTSENSLVGNLIRNGSDHVKQMMLDLLNGNEYITELDEEVIFNQLGQKEEAIWSLLVASGYLRVTKIDENPESGHDYYHLVLTDFEVKLMFEKMFTGWFTAKGSAYQGFLKALLENRVKDMNVYMSKLLLETISYFDAGSQPSEDSQPERFYHGLVLGLAASLRDEGYMVQSNRESGFGRYDIAIIPKDISRDAIIIELKVKKREEKSLEESVREAKEQIENKQYDAELLTKGFHIEQIRHYGFAFEGKKVLIG